MSNLVFVYPDEATGIETDIELSTVRIVHIHTNRVLWTGTQDLLKVHVL